MPPPPCPPLGGKACALAGSTWNPRGQAGGSVLQAAAWAWGWATSPCAPARRGRGERGPGALWRLPCGLLGGPAERSSFGTERNQRAQVGSQAFQRFSVPKAQVLVPLHSSQLSASLLALLQGKEVGFWAKRLKNLLVLMSPSKTCSAGPTFYIHRAISRYFVTKAD